MAEARGSTGKSKKDKDKDKEMKTSRKEDRAGTSAGKHNGDGQASDTVEQIQHQAGHIVDAAREEAKGQISAQVSQQKARTASSLGILASSLHDASRQVRAQDGGVTAQYIDAAATQVDQFADALQKQDVLQIVDSANEFGRRQPALYMAAAFALGFAGVRLMKSGTPSEATSEASQSSQWREGDRTWNQPSSADRFGGYGGYASPGGTGFDPGYRASRTDTALGYGQSTHAGYSAGSGVGGATGASATDTRLGSDWSAARDVDTGPEGR